MFNQFRMHYPKGSLVTELAAIDHGKYIVRCLVQVEGTPLVTGLAAAETVELAEDRARSRALALLGLSPTTLTAEPEIPVAKREVAQPPTHTSIAATAFSSEALHQPPSTRFPEPSIVTDTSRSPSFDSNREEVAAGVAVTASWGTDEMMLTDDEAPPEAFVSQDVEKPMRMEPEESSPTPLEDTPATSSTQSKRKRKQEVDTSTTTATDTPVDFSDIIARTNVELKRLGWTTQQGKDYLLQTYGKRSRQLLTDGELLDFLHHLESEATPED